MRSGRWRRKRSWKKIADGQLLELCWAKKSFFSKKRVGWVTGNRNIFGAALSHSNQYVWNQSMCSKASRNIMQGFTRWNEKPLLCLDWQWIGSQRQRLLPLHQELSWEAKKWSEQQQTIRHPPQFQAHQSCKNISVRCFTSSPTKKNGKPVTDATKNGVISKSLKVDTNQL